MKFNHMIHYLSLLLVVLENEQEIQKNIDLLLSCENICRLEQLIYNTKSTSQYEFPQEQWYYKISWMITPPFSIEYATTHQNIESTFYHNIKILINSGVVFCINTLSHANENENLTKKWITLLRTWLMKVDLISVVSSDFM